MLFLGLNPFGDFDSETKKTLPKKTSERSFQDICLDEEGQEALELKKKDRGQKNERGKKKAEAKVMTGMLHDTLAFEKMFKKLFLRESQIGHKDVRSSN